MVDLFEYLNSTHSVAEVDFSNTAWARVANIPTGGGWYFFTTDTPLDVLQDCTLWQESYVRSRDNVEAKVSNYCISKRALKYDPELPKYWDLEHVYSGHASSLRARARAHTFANPGTAALALSRYPVLMRYRWSFHYLEARRFPFADDVSESILRKLGEQVWRSENGWPLLCSG